MKLEDQARLQDILESALLVQHYTHGLGMESFTADLRTQDAVIRRFETMGEAAGRLSEETRSQFSSIPFRQIRGMRNVLAHDYGEINPSRVLATIRRDLPGPIDALGPLFPMLKNQPKE